MRPGHADLAFDGRLPGCDVVENEICDLTLGGRVPSRAIAVQQKTRRLMPFESLDHAQGSLTARLECWGAAATDDVVPSRIDHAEPISTRQCARLVEERVNGVVSQFEFQPHEKARRSPRALRADLQIVSGRGSGSIPPLQAVAGSVSERHIFAT